MGRRQNLQSLGWFNDLYKRGFLNMDPPYQRRSIWSQKYKDYFIDTILINYPAPAIFLFEEITRDGISKFHVVDGKQRLVSIFEFIQNAFPVSLTAEKTELRGKYFDELPDNVLQHFWSYSFSVEYIPTDDEAIINNIFDRINRNVANLSSQELRHARFSGLFIKSAEEMSEYLFDFLSRDFPRISTQSIKQMKEIEFVSQLLLLVEEGPKGYSSDELDSKYLEREEDWSNRFEVENRFKTTIDLIAKILRLDTANVLINSRFKNQADFYTLFGTIDQLNNTNSLPKIDSLFEKLNNFIQKLADEEIRENDKYLNEYYNHTRTASNRTQARERRIDILIDFLK